jgi:hypothetical protein
MLLIPDSRFLIPDLPRTRAALKKSESRCATDNDPQVTNMSPQVTSRPLRHLSPHSTLVFFRRSWRAVEGHHWSAVMSSRYIGVLVLLSLTMHAVAHAWGRHRLDCGCRPRLRRQRRARRTNGQALDQARKALEAASIDVIWRRCPPAVVRCSPGTGRTRHPNRARAGSPQILPGAWPLGARHDRHKRLRLTGCIARSLSIASSGSRIQAGPRRQPRAARPRRNRARARPPFARNDDAMGQSGCLRA